MFSEYIYQWLDNALDYGLTEREFWDMTIAEINRFADSQKRRKKLEAQERASYDYILADLIGRSVARTHSSANKFPSIGEAYPTLFSDEELQEKVQEKRDELSVLRFKQFANSYNKAYQEGGNK